MHMHGFTKRSSKNLKYFLNKKCAAAEHGGDEILSINFSSSTEIRLYIRRREKTEITNKN